MRADGSNPVNLTNDKAEDDFPDFSSDGRRIVWTKGGRGPTGELWVMDADGTDQRQLTFDGFSDFNATWSPDGRQIAWRSLRDDNRDIYVMNADGTNVRRLTTDPASDFACDWSPDGTHIAFTSVRSGDDAVWVMNADGRDQHQLTPDGFHGGIAGWSPDGTKLVFADGLSATCGESDLFVMNADGTGITRITDTPENELAKSWSGDGKSVVGDLGRLNPSEKHLAKGDVAVWDVATGAVTKLTDTNGIDEGSADWSLSARPSVAERGAGSGTAPAIAPGAGDLQPLDTAAWSRRGGGVANIEYTLPKAGHVRVRVFDVTGREVARPVNEWQSAGPHRTMFAFGTGSKEQIFLYRVECDGRTRSGKISIAP
jgi:Tol biopolymer transport system component